MIYLCYFLYLFRIILLTVKPQFERNLIKHKNPKYFIRFYYPYIATFRIISDVSEGFNNILFDSFYISSEFCIRSKSILSLLVTREEREIEEFRLEIYLQDLYIILLVTYDPLT